MEKSKKGNTSYERRINYRPIKLNLHESLQCFNLKRDDWKEFRDDLRLNTR